MPRRKQTPSKTDSEEEDESDQVKGGSEGEETSVDGDSEDEYHAGDDGKWPTKRIAKPARSARTRGATRKLSSRAKNGKTVSKSKKNAKSSDGSDDDVSEDGDLVGSVNDEKGRPKRGTPITVRNRVKVVAKGRGGRKAAVGKQTAAKAKKVTKIIGREVEEESNDDSSVDEVSADDSKDDDFEEPQISDVDDDESYESDDDYKPLRKSARVKSKASRFTSKSSKKSNIPKATKTNPRKSRLFGDDDEEDDESDPSSRSSENDSDEVIAPRLAKAVSNGTPQMRNSRVSLRHFQEDDDSFDFPGGPRSRRQSPRRASVQSSISYKDESDKDEDDITSPLVVSRRHSKKGKEDDEEFVPADGGNREEGSESESEFATSEESVAADEGAFDGRMGFVGEGDVGHASTSDESEPKLSASRKSQQIRKPSREEHNDSSDEEYEKNHVSLSPSLPYCSSKEDVITLAPLPRKHVCFFPPDQKSRQCFCLSTLRLIATSSSQPTFRTDLTGGKQTFLQPPHFRTPMSDDLLDQIASRFGREALDLHGPFYKRKHETVAKKITSVLVEDEDDYSDEEFLGQCGALTNSAVFNEQLQSYVKSTMGNRDIYACPLCYIVAHKNFKLFMSSDKTQSKRKVKADVTEKYPTEFSFDPMAVLGYEDNDSFEIASAFCFGRVAELKEHMRLDHHLDTKIVQGNDLYARFKVRAPDGLLQRYLKSKGSRDHSMMMNYWFEGNNASFLLLLSLISHASHCRDVVADFDENSSNDDDKVRNAEKYLQPAVNFFESFADEAEDLWKMISQPFERGTKEEIHDFIADDNEAENDDSAMYRSFNIQSAMDEHASNRKKAAEYYERSKDMDSDVASGDGDYSSKGSEDIIDNSELIFEDDSAEDMDDGDDEWQQGIVGKIQSKIESSRRKRPGNRIRPLLGSPTKRIVKDKSSGSNSPLMFLIADSLALGSNHSRKGKRAVLDDDDDDRDDGKHGTPPNTGDSHGVVKTPSSSIRKRLIIRESDEDDDS